MQVNNAIYETYGAEWWSDDAPFEFASLRFAVNPARYAYFTTLLRRFPPLGRRVLDVGCGGGYLSESFSRDGFDVSAIDPAAASIQAARRHANENGLSIDYRIARGESLPFPDDSFDIVACCDVLEHVGDLDRVIGEVSRTLKDGGILFYDTVNRTRRSWLALIKVWQDWDLLRLRARDVHAWEKFITPQELVACFEAHALRSCEIRGLTPSAAPLALLRTFLRIRRRTIRNEELAGAFGFRETNDVSVSYMGIGRKGASGG